ncbi:MAG: amidohydrolase family protein [Planctomycetaceae bacterium]
MSTDRYSLRARWILPVAGDPIENGTVEVEGERISAVHAAHDPLAIDLGNVAIIPGLVNAHTHLEFSGLKEPLEPPQPFTDWIRALIVHRQERGDATEAIRAGLIESARCGTTTVGEISTAESMPDNWPDDGPRSIVFRELLSRFPEHAESQLEIARSHLESWSLAVRSRAPDQAGPIPGLSPHATFSVHPELFRGLVDLATEFDAPLAIHVAETRAELEFLASGRGDLRRMYEDLGIWRDGTMPFPLRPLDYLRQLERLECALVIHGNYLADEEIEFLEARPQMSVVYCPRTHAYFGHRDHPWLRLRELGIRVALGTDSRASNPDLSLWNELRFLHGRFPEVDPRILLSLGTLEGARALGLEDETGSIEPGKSADLAVLSLDESVSSDPFGALLSVPRVSRAMRAGRWITP